MTNVNEMEFVYVGEVGTLIITLVDSAGVVVSIGSFIGTKQIILRSPFGLKTLTLTAAFTTDGSDGKVQAAVAAGDIDRAGEWEGQVILNKTGAVAKSSRFTIYVSESLA